VIGSTLCKFAGETKLGVEVNAHEGRVGIPRKFSTAEMLDDSIL